jgi:hypothetical protein
MQIILVQQNYSDALKGQPLILATLKRDDTKNYCVIVSASILCLGDKVFEGSQEGEECNRDLDET